MSTMIAVNSKCMLQICALLIVTMIAVLVWNSPSQSVNKQAVKTAVEYVGQSDSVHAFIVVVTRGNFKDRVVAFTAALDDARNETWIQRGGLAANWNNSYLLTNPSQSLDVLLGPVDNIIDRLASKYGHLATTVALRWVVDERVAPWNALTDYSNLPLQQYYDWTGDHLLCSWIETTGRIAYRYDVLYNRTCERNVTKAARAPRSFKPLVFNYRAISPDVKSLPSSFFTQLPAYVFNIHIYRDAIVTPLGDIITGNLKVVLLGCSQEGSPHPPRPWIRSTIYDEVYVTSQKWGNGVFHRMIEIVPRLIVGLDFLRQHPAIRIHAPGSGSRLGEFMRMLDLDPSRVVAGIVRAKVVYQPRTTQCGTASVPESQMAAQLYRRHINQTLVPGPRNRLILIRRSRFRKFKFHAAIETMLRRVAAEYGLNYTLFADNPVPSLNDTMRMFFSAVLIVAPHGAGISNIVFSQPGTYVIEGICNPPNSNLCYQRLAHVLGHRWHGLGSTGGCPSVVTISPARVEHAVRTFLTLEHPLNRSTVIN